MTLRVRITFRGIGLKNPQKGIINFCNKRNANKPHLDKIWRKTREPRECSAKSTGLYLNTKDYCRISSDYTYVCHQLPQIVT